MGELAWALTEPSLGHYLLRVNVKDRTVYANHYKYADLIAVLDTVDHEVTADLYNDTVEDFWEVANDIAIDHGFGDGVVQRAGRSGGWLEIHFSAITMTTAREAITVEKFVDDIHGAMQAAREVFLGRLQDAVTDLEKRRAINTIRSEN